MNGERGEQTKPIGRERRRHDRGPSEKDIERHRQEISPLLVGKFKDPQDEASTITELATKLANSEVTSMRDSLTGMWSRSHIYAEQSHEMRSKERITSDLWIIMLDADNLKGMNDTLGHEKGDEFLLNVAQAIESAVGDGDLEIGVAGRLHEGGDEFMIIMAGATATEVEVVARTIGDAVKKLSEQGVKVSISAGATVMVHGDTEKSLRERADKALYQSKQPGKKDRLTINDKGNIKEVIFTDDSLPIVNSPVDR